VSRAAPLIEVVMYDAAERHKEIASFTIPQAHASLMECVSRLGPMHVVQNGLASTEVLCGKPWDETGQLPVTTLGLLRDLPSMFEDVPICSECAARIPQRG